MINSAPNDQSDKDASSCNGKSRELAIQQNKFLSSECSLNLFSHFSMILLDHLLLTFYKQRKISRMSPVITETLYVSGYNNVLLEYMQYGQVKLPS